MRVIVIVADGLQTAALGPYGNDWIPTPNLNRLAEQAVVFDQHFADVPGASPYRTRHAFPSYSDSGTERLPANRCCEFVRMETLIPPWNPPEDLLAEAFEDWEFEEEPEPVLDPGPQLLDPADEVAFERIQRTYAAAVRQFDCELGVRLDQVQADDLVIVTASRGQNLGEHGLVGDDRPWLYEELIHLPLFIRLPGGAEAGRRVSHLTQPIDIAPTIFDLLEAPAPQDCHGHSLLPLCRGAGPIRQYIVASLQVSEMSECALQTADEKIIVPQSDPRRYPMYFVKPDDRYDVNDLRQSNLERAEALERVLAEYIAASQQPGPLQAPPLPEPETNDGNRQAGG